MKFYLLYSIFLINPRGKVYVFLGLKFCIVPLEGSITIHTVFLSQLRTVHSHVHFEVRKYSCFDGKLN